MIWCRRFVSKVVDNPADAKQPGRGSEFAMASSRGTQLTVREAEVLRAMASGATSREIGVQLAISENTVNFHLKNMFSKLELRNRAQLAVWAVQNGYADLTNG